MSWKGIPKSRCHSTDGSTRWTRKIPWVSRGNVWILLHARRTAEAESFVERLEACSPTSPYLSIARAELWGAQGEPDEAFAAITPEAVSLASHNELWSRELTHCYALAGRVDEAIHWFENTVRIGTINYPFLSRHDWMLDSLRGDERFDKLLEQVRTESRVCRPRRRLRTPRRELVDMARTVQPGQPVKPRVARVSTVRRY